MPSRVKFNRQGFKDLRNSPEVKAELLARAQQIAEAAGGEDAGYKVTDLVLEKPRGAVSVMATGKAHYENRRRNTLLKALDAGRD